ncbi:GNAT family N-acetyltransferase [Parasphingopyxis algicola]|uniref:GNAT family N-acetyltransferase n=1 Tax=Parasphingopyxis algicola TaxID=2026624 RepID=UPI00159FBF64|nr:GNAT family N-acetyltransferase [Parasphingopyxis algicola]QLC26321.1 GNAT family N-acetyltransferase [Parasphingopyxis algicola]
MIRAARSGELGEIGAIEESADTLFRGTHLEWAIGKWPPPRDRYERSLGEGRLWVWEEDDRIAGFLCAHAVDDLLYIDQLAVGADFQRRGIGRKLMRHVIAHARERATTLALITDRKISWNEPFYASLGFAEWPDPSPGVRAELDVEYADGFDPATRIVMLLKAD